MYTTIEADIENGKIIGPEAGMLPSHAHVLITLLDYSVKEMVEKYSVSRDLSSNECR